MSRSVQGGEEGVSLESYLVKSSVSWCSMDIDTVCGVTAGWEKENVAGSQYSPWDLHTHTIHRRVKSQREDRQCQRRYLAAFWLSDKQVFSVKIQVWICPPFPHARRQHCPSRKKNIRNLPNLNNFTRSESTELVYSKRSLYASEAALKIKTCQHFSSKQRSSVSRT